MNRETFMHNIKLTDTDIREAFEDLMVLYNVYNSVGIYENIEISKVPSSDIASFDIRYESKDIAKKVYDICEGISIRLYSVHYIISCILEDNVLHIKFMH